MYILEIYYNDIIKQHFTVKTWKYTLKPQLHQIVLISSMGYEILKQSY